MYTMFRGLRIGTLSAVRRLHTVRPANITHAKRFASPAKIAFLASGLAAFITYNSIESIRNDIPSSTEDVFVDKNASKMPWNLAKGADGLLSDFKLIGYGTRSVTFLRMKVYGLGIYIESNDAKRVNQLLVKVAGGQDSSGVIASLKDDKLSVALIDELLLNGVRFTARISPIRNTDFNHLRDGLMKSIKSGDMYKKISADSNSAQAQNIFDGLMELKDILGTRRGTAPKGSILQLEIIDKGRLRITFNENSAKSDEFVEMGIIERGLVSRLLFLQYLSGSRPLSAETRDTAIEGIIGLL